MEVMVAMRKPTIALTLNKGRPNCPGDNKHDKVQNEIKVIASFNEGSVIKSTLQLYQTLFHLWVFL